jgi:hypothetical protein
MSRKAIKLFGMKKRIAAVIALAMIFALHFSCIAQAAGLQDIYEAYGLKDGDDELFSQLYRNPPEVIALKPVKVRWFDIDIPLDVETLVLEKGKDARFSFAVQGPRTPLRLRSNPM